MKALIAVAAMQALCPGAHFHSGTDVSSYGNSISWNRAELEVSPPEVQRFIIAHECGHSHGIASETGADTYAFKRLHPVRATTDEICRELTAYRDVHRTARCNNLRRLQSGGTKSR